MCFTVFAAGAELATVPALLLQQWAAERFPLPDDQFKYKAVGESIPYQNLDLNQAWQSFNVEHELTRKGIEKFVADHPTLYEKAS